MILVIYLASSCQHRCKRTNFLSGKSAAGITSASFIFLFLVRVSAYYNDLHFFFLLTFACDLLSWFCTNSSIYLIRLNSYRFLQLQLLCRLAIVRNLGEKEQRGKVLILYLISSSCSNNILCIYKKLSAETSN